MRSMALRATLLLKQNVKRRSGATGASIRPATITATSAVIKIGGAGRWLEQGTGTFGPHHTRVVSPSGRAMAFMAGPSSAFRLTGSVRSGKAGAGAYLVVVRSTAGMPAQPFVRRSLEETAAGSDLRNVVVGLWNGGAGGEMAVI